MNSYVLLFGLQMLVLVGCQENPCENELCAYAHCTEDTFNITFAYVNRLNYYYKKQPCVVYALTHYETCNSKNGSVQGNGTEYNPYHISINLSNGVNAQCPDCDVCKIPGEPAYVVRVVLKYVCGTDSPEDKLMRVVCLYHPTTNATTETPNKICF